MKGIKRVHKVRKLSGKKVKEETGGKKAKSRVHFSGWLYKKRNFIPDCKGEGIEC